MDLAAQARTLPSEAFVGTAITEGEAHSGSPFLLLPVFTRSTSLLTLVLQDGAVDLDLASSVAGLDPGLAFGILQAANLHREEGSEPIWQLPLAVVSAGREAIGQLVERAPRIEDWGQGGMRLRLSQLVTNAVVRSCVAYLLAREMGGCQPRKAYLAGLLLELPGMARLARPETSQVTLLSILCHTLPAAVVRAVMAARADSSQADSCEPIVAIAVIAQRVLEVQAAGSELGAWLEDLAGRPLWDCWKGTDARQRMALLSYCCGTAAWAAANLHLLDPWEFTARLECGNTRR
jgi:hypothetical protein